MKNPLLSGGLRDLSVRAMLASLVVGLVVVPSVSFAATTPASLTILSNRLADAEKALLNVPSDKSAVLSQVWATKAAALDALIIDFQNIYIPGAIASSTHISISNVLLGNSLVGTSTMQPGQTLSVTWDVTGSDGVDVVLYRTPRGSPSNGELSAVLGTNIKTGQVNYVLPKNIILSDSVPNGSPTYYVKVVSHTVPTISAISSRFVVMAALVTGKLTISASPSPAAQAIVAGQAVTLANVVLNATSSSEDVRINSLVLSEIGSQSTTSTSALSACQVYKDSTALNTGSNVVNSVSNDGASIGVATAAHVTTFAFDNLLTVPKGTVMLLAVKCNISTGATGSYGFGLANKNTSAEAPIALGAQSGRQLTYGTNLVLVPGASGLQTVNAGSPGKLTVSVDPSSPGYTLAAAGATGVTMGVVRLRASNENINLTKLGLQLTNSGNTKSSGSGTSTNSGTADIYQASVYQGSTLVGTLNFDGNTYGTSTLATPITLVKDVDTLLTIKTDLATIGTSATGGVGDVVKIDPMSAGGNGVTSGMAISSGATTGVAGIKMFHSLPTFASGAAAVANPNGSNQVLKKFSITADAAGSIGLGKITVALAATSASVTNLKLYAYADPSYSQPANVPGTTGGQFGATTSTSSDVVSFMQTKPLQVSAGTTLYFSVVGTVAPSTSANNWVISVRVLGDTARSSSPTGYNVNTLNALNTQSNHFLWSDNATGTAIVTDIDWANGYAVPGLNGL